MVRIAYTPAQKHEAIALASIQGAEAAGAALGIDPRTIRRWCAAAGKASADALTPASWQSLMDLAMARTQAAVALGKMRPKDIAVVAAIARRNLDRPDPPEERDPDDDLNAAINARYGRDDARQARDLVTYILQVELRRLGDARHAAGEDDPYPSVTGEAAQAQERDPALGQRVNDWLLAILDKAVNLEAAIAEHRAWLDAQHGRERLVSERAAKLAREGHLTYFRAREMAELITTDFPMPPEPEYPPL